MHKNTRTIGSALLIAFSLVGMAIMAYLISLHFSPTEGAFCNLGEGLSCDVVNKSIYAEIFGIPVAALGFFYFAAIFILILWRREKTPYKLVAFFSIVFLGSSLYLTGIEIFVLKNICILCEISKALMVAIVVTSFATFGWKHIPWTQILAAIFLATAFGWVMYVAQGSVVLPGKYTSFAQCVYEKGLRMYGAKTCSFCIKQRALFGDAVQYIREIECDPRYPNNEVERCIAKNIERTPTWILEDREGNTLKRFEPGVLSLETLSKETGCKLP